MAIAQDKFGITITPAANYPVDELGTTKLKNGFGGDVSLSFNITENLGISGGWGWNKFSASESFAGSDIFFEEKGYSAGILFMQPIGDSKMKLIFGAGGTYKHIETQNSNSELIYDSGLGWGWEAKTGFSFPLGEHFNVIPTLKYSELSRDIEFLTLRIPVDLRYLSLGVGFNWTL